MRFWLKRGTPDNSYPAPAAVQTPRAGKASNACAKFSLNYTHWSNCFEKENGLLLNVKTNEAQYLFDYMMRRSGVIHHVESMRGRCEIHNGERHVSLECL